MCNILLFRSTTKPLFGEEYSDKFDPQVYLQMYYTDNSDPFRLFLIKQLHDFYQSYDSTASKLKILDIGTGPVIAYTISAAPYASEIVLSEYTEANRDTLLKWLKNDPKVHNWTPFFRYIVVDLEGESEEKVPVRAELVRKVIKAVVPCDVNSDPPIPAQYVDQYDIITSFLVLGSACATQEDYVAALVRLHALLKPGGAIVLYASEMNETPTQPRLSYDSYRVGSHNFFYLQLPRGSISTLLEQAGFCDVKIRPIARQGLQAADDEYPPYASFNFVTAYKSEMN